MHKLMLTDAQVAILNDILLCHTQVNGPLLDSFDGITYIDGVRLSRNEIECGLDDLQHQVILLRQKISISC